MHLGKRALHGISCWLVVFSLLWLNGVGTGCHPLLLVPRGTSGTVFVVGFFQGWQICPEADLRAALQ